jgi:hypothetical protein
MGSVFQGELEGKRAELATLNGSHDRKNKEFSTKLDVIH